MTAEEQVIRDWLDGQLSESGSPLPPSRRLSQPLPRRQVVAVVATLIGLLDAARAGVDVERLGLAVDRHNEKEEPFAAVHCNTGDDCHLRIAQDYAEIPA